MHQPQDAAPGLYNSDADRREHNRDVLLLLTLAALCYLDKILLGPYAFVDFYDSLEVHFAHFQNMFTLWREFGAYSWYPFNAGGVPAFVGQHPPYHPAVFLAGVLPLWVLSLLWNMGQMFLAGYGMLRLLRLLGNPARSVRLFCAALFALTWISGNVHITLAYAFPAFFAWTVDLARPELPRRTRLLAGLGLLFVALISFPVLALPHFPALHLALVLFLGRGLPRFWRQVAFVFLVWTGYVLLFIPSIVSLFLYIPFAQRDWAFHYPGLAPALKDLARFLYGRITDQHLLPLLLLSLTLIRHRRVQAMLALFAGILLISGLFSSDMKGIFADTFLAKMDIFFLASTLGVLDVLLAALTLEHFRRSEAELSWKTFAACALALTLFGSSHVVLRNLFLLAGCAGLLALVRRGRTGRVLVPLRLAPALLAVGLAGLGMFTRQEFMAAGAFVPYARGFEAHPGLAQLGRESTRHPFRVAAVDVHPALLQAYGLDTVGGKGPLFNKRYKQVVKEAVRPQLRTPALEAAFEGVWRQTYLTRNRADQDQRPLALKPDSPRSAADFNLGLLRLLGVTHLISATPVAGMESFAPAPVVHPGRSNGVFGLGLLADVYSLPLYDYALNDAPGLGFLAGQAVVAEDSADLLRRMGAASAEGLLHTVFLLRADLPADFPTAFPADSPAASPVAHAPGASDPAHRTASAPSSPTANAKAALRLDSWSPDRLAFSGMSAGPALLLVANNYDPRWTATVNGQPAPLVRADHAFQAVLVDRSGPFTAELTFRAPLIWQLHVLSGLGLLLFCGAFSRQLQGQSSGQRTGQGQPLQPPQPDAASGVASDLAAGLVADEAAVINADITADITAESAEAEPVRCSTPRLLLAGLGAAALWAVGFGLFVLRRYPAGDAQYEAMRYALATIPLIGVAVALWTRGLLKRL